MADNSVVVSGEIIADGKLHRVYNGHMNEDKHGSKNAWYLLNIDFPPNGMFGCNKRLGDTKIQWSKEIDMSTIDPEVIERVKQEAAANKLKREAERREREEKAAVRANSIWSKSQAVVNAEHPYLKRKKVRSHGLRSGPWDMYDAESQMMRTVDQNALYVPLYGRDRKIQSIQAIFSDKDKVPGRDKTFLPGGRKEGLFYAVGKAPLFHEGSPVFILSEGYATAATIHEVTDHLVLACFDCGNLVKVAKEIKASVPTAMIVIAADNDQWTTRPMNNPGLTYATRAAEACDGKLALPPFSYDEGQPNSEGELSGPSDFNDLMVLRGFDAVREVFEQIFNPKPAEIHEINVDLDPDIPESDGEEKSAGMFDDRISKNPYYAVLGYDESNYWFFQREKGQVLKISRSELSASAMVELAPLNFWEMNFPHSKNGFDPRAVLNRLIREANYRGIYDPRKVRGRGAWRDNGRFVFHMGDYLRVGQQAHDLFSIKTDYIYSKARSLPDTRNHEPITYQEGREILETAKLIRWSQPGSALLICGWAMLAPVCGMLSWRPHVWITGKAGSGKSHTQSRFVGSLLRGIALNVLGSSSEPGIRQEIRSDAIPVLVDEMEPNNESDRKRVEGILTMIRQSSSETMASVLKGTTGGRSMSFMIRSMFCLASINTQLNKKSDIDRLTKLYVKNDDEAGEDPENWDQLNEVFHRMETDKELPHRFLARAVGMIPVIDETVTNFTAAAAEFFGSQRYGDQFGTMLAGTWCLCNDHAGTKQDAEDMLNAYDWREHTEDADDDDAERALEAILGSELAVYSGVKSTIYELICDTLETARGSFRRTADIQAEAQQVLARYGIRVDERGDRLLFGVGVSNLHKLVEKFSFGTDLRGQLNRIHGATKYGNAQLRFNGVKSYVVAIPLSPIISDITDGVLLSEPL
ncbi:DNA primase/helicase [Morganella phage Mecenats66]|nr:DNA primase/helicase [Morganella phage Mecenats66]